MSSKKSGAPPRPPAPTLKSGTPSRPPVPKVSLDKVHIKPSTTGTSLSIRFKSLEEEDDGDLSFLASNKNESSKIGLKSESNGTCNSSPSISESNRLSKFHAASRSLDEERLHSSISRASEIGKEEKRTLFSAVKDKLSDKFPDTINALTKKWEELSGESSSPENEGRENLDKSGTNKSGNGVTSKNSRSSLTTSVSSPSNIGSVPNSLDKSVKDGRHPLGDDFTNSDAAVCSSNVPSSVRPRVPSVEEVVEDDIEILDDFYCVEAMEDFDGNINLPVSGRLSDQSNLRQRSPMQRLVKHRTAKSSAGVPVSMSSLMKNVSEESPESVEYDGNVFFDPSEESRKNKSATFVMENSNPSETDIQKIESSDSHQPDSQARSTDSTIPVRKLGIVIICLFLYLIVPLPSYISGVVMGAVLASLSWAFYLWLVKPPEPRQPIKIEPLEKLPPMLIPEMKEPRPGDGKYKGWMNELLHYDQENYHINQTYTVFLRLEGTSLRLSRPKVNVSKRAMWDEPNPSPQFIHQRHFDVEGSRVFLLPPGLVKKRLWSKKYPICVALAKPGNKSQLQFSSDDDTEGLNLTSSPVASPAKEAVPGFELLMEQNCDSSILYLFARTSREKEEWYHRLNEAAKGKPLCNHLLEIRKALEFKPKHRRSSSDQPTLTSRHKRQSSTDSACSVSSSMGLDDSPKDETVQTPSADIGTFAQYMARLMPAERSTKASSPSHLRKDSKEGKELRTYSGGINCDPQLVWLNALMGRCFWDFLLQHYWKDKIKEKLEKKLSKIHVPYFIEELRVTDIDLGSEMPIIRRPSKPYIDERGFWVDLDVAYNGGFRMTMETKLNLMRLKRNKTKPNSDVKLEQKRSAVLDSDEEDSAESSTDEEGEETVTTPGDEGSSGGAGKKLLKYIDRITQSKYFQHATEYKYIKKAMEEVSNTPLILTVELHTLVGTLAINIPPPPSDRLWYGFRGNPRLWLVAKPKVGEREVTVTHVTEWIEKKLAVEFQRVFVMPNMDDLVIPLLISGLSTDSVPPVNTAHRNNSTEV